MIITNILLLLLCIIIDKKYGQTKGKYEAGITFMGFLLLMINYMYMLGVINSGYHLIDDHEIYTYGNYIVEKGYWNALQTVLYEDMMGITNSRFRFLYIIVRVTQIALWQDHFVIWHIAYALLSGCNMYLMYAFLRKYDIPRCISFAGALLLFYGGGQSEVIWRLGPQENLGITVLLLLLHAAYYYSQTKRIMYKVSCIVLTILLGGVKESFLLLMPIVPFLMILMEHIAEGEFTFEAFASKIKREIGYILITFVVCLIDLGIIVFVIGTNSNGYAGVELNNSIMQYLKQIYHVLTLRLDRYWGFALLGCILVLWWIKKNQITIERDRRNLFYVLMGLYVGELGIQIVIHMKSGMFTRYLLPSVVIFILFMFHSMLFLLQNTGKGYQYYQGFLLCMTVIFLLIGKDDERALTYAKEGKGITETGAYLAEHYDNHAKIVVGMGYEADLSFSTYMQNKYQIDQVYNIYYSGITEEGQIYDCYQVKENQAEKIPVTEADIYVMQEYVIEDLSDRYDLCKEDYSLNDLGNGYQIWVRK